MIIAPEKLITNNNRINKASGKNFKITLSNKLLQDYEIYLPFDFYLKLKIHNLFDNVYYMKSLL